MTLYELGTQYLQQEVILRGKIAVLKNETVDETLKRRLYYLKREAQECALIGRYLMDYYNREGKEFANKVFTV